MPNRNVLARFREVRALELMTAGATYQQVAEELGYRSRAGAWQAVQRALDRRTVEAVDLYRLVELKRLESLQAAAWHRASEGDLDAVGKVLAIIRMRCRLLGLYGGESRDEGHGDDSNGPSLLASRARVPSSTGEGDAAFAAGLARLYGCAIQVPSSPP